ncbi:MAG: TrbC/VirB2 family protein [Thiothrix sp.]|nr:TrbC/VirB2 family protein [Thiothrix sp.]HPQ94809.1 TrbC/VirB2 family protein [Thiolinea sp.]
MKLCHYLVLLALLAVNPVWAGSATGLPWETPLETLQNSFHYIAYFIAFIALVVAGGMLIWGGELSEFGRRMVMIVLVVALLAGAAGVMGTLFGGQTALV